MRKRNEQEIRPTGFFRNKTKSIMGTSRGVLEHFKGQVPRTMDEILTLPGVARKTANVVLGTAYGIASGVVVDTHVIRLSRRLDLTKHEESGLTQVERILQGIEGIAFHYFDESDVVRHRLVRLNFSRGDPSMGLPFFVRLAALGSGSCRWFRGVDPRIRQTSAASPAEPGGLPR